MTVSGLWPRGTPLGEFLSYLALPHFCRAESNALLGRIMIGTCWFYRDTEDWHAIADRLKLTACPHCHVVGMLIRHGGWRGFDEGSGQTVLRAWRVFCSNRNARTGCGRTVSVWWAERIRRLKVSTRRLGTFLGLAVAGPLEVAIRALDSRLSERTWQRIWRRFLLAQSAIRTALANRCPVPARPETPSRRPAALVLAHLQAAFPSAACSIAAFQQTIRSSRSQAGRIFVTSSPI